MGTAYVDGWWPTAARVDVVTSGVAEGQAQRVAVDPPVIGLLGQTES
jgi:hypothetical protein